jgi:hypothetical protein
MKRVKSIDRCDPGIGQLAPGCEVAVKPAQGLKAKKNNTVHNLLYCFPLQSSKVLQYIDCRSAALAGTRERFHRTFLEPWTDASRRMFIKLQCDPATSSWLQVQDPHCPSLRSRSHPIG